MLATFVLTSGFHQHRVPTGRLFLIVIVFYQHVVPNGTKTQTFLPFQQLKHDNNDCRKYRRRFVRTTSSKKISRYS
jgi:hypothetical protein